jgi:RNA polymerase sigma-70 factor (ECF subfamily)
VAVEAGCRICGKALPRQTGKPGRASLYCSAACRQRAYRSRIAPAGAELVPELIAEIEQRVKELAPQRPLPFYTDVTALSSSVGRLRRIAKQACAATGDDDGPATENVTPEPVTPPAPAPAPAPEDTADQPDHEPDHGVVEALRAGDEWAFAGLVERHRRELQVHCYRMVGSYDDSEDLVQETLLRAWRRRETFEGRASFRAWLYRIATNTCLDFLRANTRVPQHYTTQPGFDHGSAEPPARIPWLQAYPDELLTEIATDEPAPDTEVVAKETMELVFLVAIQHLPPRQRAVLIMRDVLGWPATDTAAQLDMSVAAVNSALQRARPTVREQLPGRRVDWSRSASSSSSEQERTILRRYMAAAAEADLDAMAELLSADARLTMPPNPMWFIGREAILNFVAPTFDPSGPGYFGRWRHLPTRANRQPAVAGYVQRPGTTVYRAQLLDVLRIENGKIAEITTFEPHVLPDFGLPLKL